MDKQDALKVLIFIEKLYPLIMIKSETVVSWLKDCKSIDYDEVMTLLRLHKKTSPYPPTMKELAKTRLSEVIRDGEDWLSEYSIRNS